MVRTFKTFPVTDIEFTKQQMLNWADQFNICCFMDNHYYPSPYHAYECLLALGSTASYDRSGNHVKALDDFYNLHHDWIFGHFNYEQNAIITSNQRPDRIGFPATFLFVPLVVIILKSTTLEIGSIHSDHDELFSKLLAVTPPDNVVGAPVAFTPRMQKEEYVKSVNSLLDHIHRGDCYEINFCQEFYSEGVAVDPLSVYKILTSISPNPFSAFYKINDKYLLCASPERFLRKTHRTLISQPIKGTWSRDMNDVENDRHNQQALQTSVKDRIENVMVVDLVRNDLSQICHSGSVKVDELFGIYAFPQVYQMISTISGQLKDTSTFCKIMSSMFPMGSMTGAPKKRVMELIEMYETSGRGIYSGTIGYITPQKDFDFNVVIRSIMYNEATHYISYQVGAGITSNSIPEKEYEECLLKAEGIRKVFS